MIWDRIQSAADEIGLPYAANTYLSASGDPLPDEYFVYFLVSSIPDHYADNQETFRVWTVQINYYSRSGFASLASIDQEMARVGFIKGLERELPRNNQTRHFGIALEYTLSGVIAPIEESI